jgi:8-hydroxy-5-deazaflavin:NADPH oxidoreductase
MRIAVIGTGNIGGTLGGKWRAAGHDVVFGSRNPSGPGPGGAPLVPAAEAISAADAVLFAVPGRAVADIVAANGAALAPVWFALVQQRGGNRRIALSIVQ